MYPVLLAWLNASRTSGPTKCVSSIRGVSGFILYEIELERSYSQDISHLMKCEDKELVVPILFVLFLLVLYEQIFI